MWGDDPFGHPPTFGAAADDGRGLGQGQFGLGEQLGGQHQLPTYGGGAAAMAANITQRANAMAQGMPVMQPLQQQGAGQGGCMAQHLAFAGRMPNEAPYAFTNLPDA